MSKYIDPPSGWMYGFPKPIPEYISDIRAWLITNGYPEEEIESWGDNFTYRCWYDDEKEND